VFPGKKTPVPRSIRKCII